jgi:hypothetical protein
MGPFHIRSQILRQSQLEPATALGVFTPRAEEGVPAPAGAEMSGRGRWRQSDVKRAVAAAEQAGLEAYRVEVAPDGTISIVVGAPAETAASPADRGSLAR